MNKNNKSTFYELKYILHKTLLFINKDVGNADAFHGKNILTDQVLPPKGHFYSIYHDQGNDVIKCF